MEEKKEKKDQFIIAYLTDLENTKPIIDSAIAFSKLLDKGLILLFISDKKFNNISSQEAEKKLKELNQTIELNFHSYCAIEGNTKEIIESLPHLLSGVLIISSVNKTDKTKANHYNNILKNFYASRIAYLVIEENFDSIINFNSIILSLENFRESKEKVLWASYFGRFAGSELTLFYHNYKDEFFHRQLRLNIAFAKKMFSNFSLNFNYFESKDTKTFVDHQAILFAKEEGYDLIICQTTKNRNWTNKLLGLRERKTIIDNYNIPILFVNPREDLFILCE